MQRGALDAKEIRRVAAATEVRVAKALHLSMERMRNFLPINTLAMALANKNARLALTMLSDATIKDTLTPQGRIFEESFMKGGKIGAAALNRQ